MKKAIKILLSAFLLTLAFILSFSLIASAEVVEGHENGCVWTLDTTTKKMTLSVGLKDIDKKWDGYEHLVEYLYIPNATIESGLRYNYAEEFPNLKVVSGNWHLREYDLSIRPELIAPWKKGDPEAYWEINLETRTMTIDAHKNPFEDCWFFAEKNSYHTYQEAVGIWHDFEDYIDTLVLGDGITLWESVVEDNMLFWGFNIKRVKLGKNVKVFDGLILLAQEEYEVDPQNPNLAAYEGALYTKDYKTLVALPYKNINVKKHPNFKEYREGMFFGEENGSSWKYDLATKTMTYSGKGVWKSDGLESLIECYGLDVKRLVISDGITEIAPFRYRLAVEIDYLYIGKDFQNYDGSYVPDIAYEVAQNNAYFATRGGFLYTKNYDTLIKTPPKVASISIHPNTKEILPNSIGFYDFRVPVIIPQGVTTIPSYLFDGSGKNPVILPDTLTKLGFQDDIRLHYYKDLFYSDKNKVAKESGHKSDGKIKYELLPDELKKAKTVEDIYKLTNNGQTLRNLVWVSDDANYKRYLYEDGKMITGLTRVMGKAMIFDSNGVMQYNKWVKYDGKWYYLNNYGAGAVKIWLKSGGKWYYMQEDGTMATSKWIKWYNKWYYVGADGAMYANRRTPDGYWVNASGVWVK